MRIKISNKRCKCEHCMRKLEQTRQAKTYWDKLIFFEERAA